MIKVPLKNCDLLFCCHFWHCLMLKMAAFQQTSSATLLHHLTTHQLMYCSCLRPLIDGCLHSWFPKELINCFNVTLHLHKRPKMASFSNLLAGLWPVLSCCSYISLTNDLWTFCPLFFWPTATTTSDLYFSLFLSYYLLSSHFLNNLKLSGSSYAWLR